MSMYLLGAAVLAALVLVFVVITVINLRRVVPANEVHIVQTHDTTISYGKGKQGGNTYYEWPTWLPLLGLTKVVLPVSNFAIHLHAYEAYDKDRVPFVLDLVAFFRIDDSDVAAERVSSFKELEEQLTAVVQGAARAMLASQDIHTIMTDRASFGEHFTKDVTIQLTHWGVEPVKNIELMDIRDAKESKVIHNIMAKRTSAIESESRVVVAEERRKADIAEIEAKRETELQSQVAQQQIGIREAERLKAVGLSKQVTDQEIAEQQKLTKQKQMEVVKVEQTVQAEIDAAVAVVKAEAQRKQVVITAEAVKQETILNAEATLETEKRNAEATKLNGEAKAAADKAVLLAPVEAQITLAKEIGENEGYQHYLLRLREIESSQAIGISQSEALKAAEIRIIANAGSPSAGIRSVGELFTSQGGMALGSMLEGLKATEVGEKVVSKVLNDAKK